MTALLCGPTAFGPRIGGRLGTWWQAIGRRLRPVTDPYPNRIPTELIDHVEVVVDDRVEKRVQDETGRREVALPETLLDLDARPALALVDRHDRVSRDEDRKLVESDLPGRRRLDRVEHDEVVILVLVDLRPLVAVLGILDGERMEPELRRDTRELGTLRVGDVDPARLLAVRVDLLGRSLDDGRLVADEKPRAHEPRIGPLHG